MFGQMLRCHGINNEIVTAILRYKKAKPAERFTKEVIMTIYIYKYHNNLFGFTVNVYQDQRFWITISSSMPVFNLKFEVKKN